jgi:hypothetical protein
VGGTERGGYRSLADRNRSGDRSVVEIGVVAEEENETLPLGELLDRRTDEITPGVIDRRSRVRQLVELMLHSLLRACVTRCVHDDLPHPSLEIAPTLEAMALPHRPHERLVDDVGRKIRATDYCGSDATQLGEPSFVHRS